MPRAKSGLPSRTKKNGSKTTPHEPYAGDTEDRPHIKSATEIQQAMRDNQIPDGDNTTALVEKNEPKTDAKESPAPKAEIKIPALIQDNIFVRYEYTDQEKLAIGQKFAQANSQITTLKANLKAITSDYKSKIQGHEAEVGASTEQINSGFEMREMKCNVLHNRDARPPFKAYYRADNGEFVRKDPMTHSDLSMLSQPWPKGHKVEDHWLPDAPKWK